MILAYICLGRLRKTTINLSTSIWKHYLRSLLDRCRKSMKTESYLNQSSCKISCAKKEIKKTVQCHAECLLYEAANSLLSTSTCPAGWGHHEVTAGSWCLSWVSCARYASRAWLAHAPSRETDKTWIIITGLQQVKGQTSTQKRILESVDAINKTLYSKLIPVVVQYSVIFSNKLQIKYRVYSQPAIENPMIRNIPITKPHTSTKNPFQHYHRTRVQISAKALGI
jgi:hypothetical protein